MSQEETYRVAAPLRTEKEITSITVQTDDGRTVVYDDRCGTYSRSRFQPNVLEFASKEEIIE